MINQFIRYCFSQSTMDEDEAEIIFYGMKIIGTSILTSLIVILIGIIMGQAVSAVIYLGTLILLRRNVGGYHSKTYLGCLFITSLNFMIIVFLEKWLSNNLKEIIGIIFIIYATIKIYLSKPIVHKNRIVNQEIINKSNTKKDEWLSVILALATICHILTVLGLVNEINYFFAISSSLMIVALSINNKTKGEEDGYEESFK
ncbi:MULTISPECIES: accessory gene regulator B family protein [Tissierella]|uniref:accessory gene regulator B family protein n=1 Tax=Tissierella TaxID=41273 RepID=UPI0028AA0D67|nr:accessory gene regulator B family protein [Tissierella sp.]